MSGEVIPYARKAIELVAELEALRTVPDVMEALRKAFSEFGYSAFVLTGPRKHPAQSFRQSLLAKYWPDDWYRIYIHEQLFLHDPVSRRCRRDRNPFLWSEALHTMGRDDAARRVMGIAADFGLREGYCVPIHGAGGFESGVSLGGENLDLTPKALSSVQLVAIWACNKIATIVAGPETDEPLRLSPREREVLTWIAAGKTTEDTGCILSISRNTVQKHVDSAARKLDACNGTQATVKALMRGEIQI